jgi:A/G-specific adenine glycosylase
MTEEDAHHFPPEATAGIQEALLAWYRRNCRQLPWRQTQDPYRIWVSEVMLQQTQVRTVIGYYGNFIHRFPDLQALAAADQQEVLKCWEGLGYYARARNLHRAARIVCQDHGGRVPDRIEVFRRLPGVGDYIAAAVQSIAFGQAHAVVDGNVKRVLARLACVEAPVNLPAAHRRFRALAEKLLARDCPDRFNQALMELGALVCRPESPDCSSCPLEGHCLARRRDLVGRYPLRKKARKVPTHHVAVGVVCKQGRLFITQRAPQGLLGGLWEFPGGKLQPGEDAASACIREIQEETGLRVEVVEPLARVHHAYTHFKIRMDVFICRFAGGRVRLRGPVASRWIAMEEIDSYPFPKANHKFLPELRKRAAGGL